MLENKLKNSSKNKIFFMKSIDTITTKLLMLVLFITVIPVVVVGNYSLNIINNNIQKSIERELTIASKLIEEEFRNETDLSKENINKIANSVANLSGLNVEVKASSFKNSCTAGTEKYQTWVCKPIKDFSGEEIGILYISIPENAFVNPFYKNINLISIVAVISLFIAICIAALFARTITTPILRLVEAAKHIAEGNLEHKVEIKGNDEVAQLSAAFNQMGSDLKKQELLKDNFVATLTHDLKVPMLAENKTIGFMLKEAYGTVTEEQKEVLELIKSTNNSSLEMISTLLEVYRLDQGNRQINKSNFDIIDLVQKSIEQIYSLAHENKITVGLKSDQDKLIVNADENEIKRVIHNLISNAIINSTQNGHIYCNIEPVKDEITYSSKLSHNTYTTLDKPVKISNSAIISIEDNGAGITKDDMSQLFKRFSLSKGRQPAGSGLGLYYSCQVINGHNGIIWAESSEGKGSFFKFTLPLGE